MKSNIKEASYSRLWSHTKDGSCFAIIGSEDKDTKKSRYEELKELIKGVMVYNSEVGYNKIDGTYTYKLTGETTFEKGLVVYNISRDDAIRVASKINQESIIWKDKNFFGIIGLDGSVIEQFNNHERNMNFSKAKSYGFGTKLQKDDTNPGRSMGFAFEKERVKMKKTSMRILESIKDSGSDFDKKRDFLYSMYDKIKARWDSIDWHEPMYFEMDMDVENLILIITVDGDWKHDHGAIDQIAREETHPYKMDEVVTEETDGDWYTSDHYFYYKLEESAIPKVSSVVKGKKPVKESADYPAIEKDLMNNVKEFLSTVEGVSDIEVYVDLEYNNVCKYKYNGETFVVSVGMIN